MTEGEYWLDVAKRIPRCVELATIFQAEKCRQDATLLLVTEAKRLPEHVEIR